LELDERGEIVAKKKTRIIRTVTHEVGNPPDGWWKGAESSFLERLRNLERDNTQENDYYDHGTCDPLGCRDFDLEHKEAEEYILVHNCLRFDVELVISQTFCTVRQAVNALVEKNQDIVEAIMLIFEWQQEASRISY
jgi:NACalpha-BTF3-like transcription factor